MTDLTIKTKTKMYINLQRVTPSGGDKKNQTLEVGEHKTTLDHLDPHMIARLVRMNVYKEVEE